MNKARNIYSKDLLKIIYVDNDLSNLCELDESHENSDSLYNKMSVEPSSSSATSSVYMPNTVSIPVGGGARCLKINPGGSQLATGDRCGNIRIYDLITLESTCMIEAHLTQVLYLQYSQPESGRMLLASSSRDRFIHIYDASKSTFDLVQTLADHSASITAVRFSFNSIDKQLYLVSCGSDKSVMIRTQNNEAMTSLTSTSGYSSSSTSPNFCTNTNTNTNNNTKPLFSRTSYVVEKQTFFDLNIDSSNNQIYTISQDRMIRTYSLKDGKKTASNERFAARKRLSNQNGHKSL
jgi:WD40 repeat protein